MTWSAEVRLTLRTGILSMLALLVASGPVAAQSAQLTRVEELTRLGRVEEAREALTDWWEAERDGASRDDIQRSLWLRGRLTVDPAQADLDYSRLLVLYPSGPYAPPSLLRLAQGAFARGDVDAARRHVAMLARDYPSSAARAEGEAWLASAGDVPDGQSGDATATGGRPAGGASATTVSTGAATTSGGFDWSVQFGAFADEDRALALYQELIDAGMAARLVRVGGSGFLHVRIGRFATRVEASDQLQAVTARGFSAAIVRDERPEEPVRR